MFLDIIYIPDLSNINDTDKFSTSNEFLRL